MLKQGPISVPLLEPAPAPVPEAVPVPVPDQGLAPVPVPDQVPAPAPVPEVAPAPIPENGPIPYPEALVALLQNQVPQVPFNPERLARLVAPFTHFKRVTVGDTNGGVLELPAKLARDLSNHININILRVIFGGRVELQNNVPQFWVWARSHNSVVNRRMAFVNNYRRSSLSTASWREICEGRQLLPNDWLRFRIFEQCLIFPWGACHISCFRREDVNGQVFYGEFEGAVWILAERLFAASISTSFTLLVF